MIGNDWLLHPFARRFRMYSRIHLRRCSETPSFWIAAFAAFASWRISRGFGEDVDNWRAIPEGPEAILVGCFIGVTDAG